jgi:prepilin-type processing-associated H-X9-DG protein
MEEMGIIESRAADVVQIMHWDNGLELQRNPGLNPWWNCRAINFTNVPAINAIWTSVQTVPDSQGRKPNVSSLTIGSVTRPGSYPLLIDSSSFSGLEIFRINEGNGDLVGLRSNGKANAVMLDGSARTMDKVDLKAAGFKKAYDNSTTPPKSITL